MKDERSQFDAEYNLIEELRGIVEAAAAAVNDPVELRALHKDITGWDLDADAEMLGVYIIDHVRGVCHENGIHVSVIGILEF